MLVKAVIDQSVTMRRLYPQESVLKPYINYYWVVDNVDPFTQAKAALVDFPSLCPELLIGLQGSLQVSYKGRSHIIRGSVLFPFVDERIIVDPQKIERVVLVKFKPLGLAAVLPFCGATAKQLIHQPIVSASALFGAPLEILSESLFATQGGHLVEILDSWFKHQLDARKNGLLADLGDEMSPAMSVAELRQHAGFSCSSLERYFKKETAMSPKQFLMLNRFRHVMEEIATGTSHDWFDYVVKYGYYDQNHFIKEVKRYSGYTPAALLALDFVRPYRPEAPGEFIR
ncbi:MAG: helix-turn-helix domain-containing protein [Bacteroidota bacterium]